MRVLALLLLLAACGGGSSGPRPSQPSPSIPAAPEVTVGLNAHSLTPRDINELGALRVRWVRTTLYAEQWEGAEGYDEEFIAGLALAFGHGIKTVVVVHQLNPQWDAETFALWLQNRVRQFGPMVYGYQIGNEDWSMPGSLSVADYNAWMEVVYPAVKQANPAALVVTRALQTEEMARGFDAPADVLALHLYDGLAAKTRMQRGWLPADARVWATEFGTANEAAKLGEWQACIGNAYGYEVLFGYALRAPDETHGIVRDDGSLTPTAEWLRGLR